MGWKECTTYFLSSSSNQICHHSSYGDTKMLVEAELLENSYKYSKSSYGRAGLRRHWFQVAKLVWNLFFHNQFLIPMWTNIIFNFRSFLVGDDAIYEGAGWHVRGAHTFGYNTNGTGIAFIGDFTEQLPTPNAIENVKKLLACGVQRGELDSNYNLLAARQVTATESPGLELYSEIQEWRNWHSQP